MRNIHEVIDRILPLIPDGDPLRDSLTWLKQDSRYKAPEQMSEQWGAGGMMIAKAFNKVPPEQLTEEWQKAVVRIWLNLEAQ